MVIPVCDHNKVARLDAPRVIADVLNIQSIGRRPFRHSIGESMGEMFLLSESELPVASWYFQAPPFPTVAPWPDLEPEAYLHSKRCLPPDTTICGRGTHGTASHRTSGCSSTQWCSLSSRAIPKARMRVPTVGRA